MRFSIARKVEELSFFFTRMQIRIVEDAWLKVEKWNSNASSKGAIE